jgi:hypothetical protein
MTRYAGSKVNDLDCTSTTLMPWTARQSGTQ